MKRKEFLRSLGAGAAFALTFPCVQGCSKDETTGEIRPEPTNVDFVIDLTSEEGLKLAEKGSFILRNDVVVAKNLEGNFIAASQICSHEAYDQVRFQKIDGGIFHCDVHGSRFKQDGTPLNQVDSKQPKPLKVFKVSVEENQLRVYE